MPEDPCLLEDKVLERLFIEKTGIVHLQDQEHAVEVRCAAL